MNMSKIGRARAQALGAKKAPSQQPHKHWAPRHNNQTGSFTQTPFPFFLMMLSWRPVLALGAKKRYGRLLSARASTRRHQGAREHQNATIKMLSLSLSSCSFFSIIQHRQAIKQQLLLILTPQRYSLFGTFLVPSLLLNNIDNDNNSQHKPHRQLLISSCTSARLRI